MNVGIITCIKINRIIVSRFSQWIYFFSDSVLDIFVVNEDCWKWSFKSSFEIAIFTVEYTIENWFEKKCFTWISVIWWSWKDRNMFLFSKDDSRAKFLISNIFVEYIFVVIYFNNRSIGKFTQNLLSEWIVFSFGFQVDNHKKDW